MKSPQPHLLPQPPPPQQQQQKQIFQTKEIKEPGIWQEIHKNIKIVNQKL